MLYNITQETMQYAYNDQCKTLTLSETINFNPGDIKCGDQIVVCGINLALTVIEYTVTQTARNPVQYIFKVEPGKFDKDMPSSFVMTNEKKIKTLSTDKLASFLHNMGFCPSDKNCDHQNCIPCIIKYLEREIITC